MLTRRSLAQREAKFVNRSHESSRRIRRLAVRLAARTRELEAGQWPARTADLVPGILGAVPVDPETGVPMDEVPPAGK